MIVPRVASSCSLCSEAKTVLAEYTAAGFTLLGALQARHTEVPESAYRTTLVSFIAASFEGLRHQLVTSVIYDFNLGCHLRRAFAGHPDSGSLAADRFVSAFTRLLLGYPPSDRPEFVRRCASHPAFGVPAEFPPSRPLLPRDLHTFSHFAIERAHSQRDELLQLHRLDDIDSEHAALALNRRFFAAVSATSSGNFRRPAPPLNESCWSEWYNDTGALVPDTGP